MTAVVPALLAGWCAVLTAICGVSAWRHGLFAPHTGRHTTEQAHERHAGRQA